MEYVNNRSYFQTIWAPIAAVGWYIVGLAVIAYFAFPHIEERYKNWKLARKQQDAALGKKTDQLPQMSANVELARQKMQEAYNDSCVVSTLKEEEEKEKKRQKVLKILEKKNVGRRLGSSDSDNTDNDKPSTSTKSNSFKTGYNPLMGDNTRGYRPPKRSCCGKGGCG